jgi:hypothetical protein
MIAFLLSSLLGLRPDQIVEGGSFVPSIPEKDHGLLDGSSSVEQFWVALAHA